MDSSISWCADCGRHVVMDRVPNAMPTEYACRRCAGAYLIEPTPSADRWSLPVAA